jgi:hypothetical protein
MCLDGDAMTSELLAPALDAMLILADEISELAASFGQLCPPSDQHERFAEVLIMNSARLIQFLTLGIDRDDAYAIGQFRHDGSSCLTPILACCQMLPHVKSNKLLSHHLYLLERIAMQTGALRDLLHQLASDASE